MPEVVIRPMRADDVPACEPICGLSDALADQRAGLLPATPPPRGRTPQKADRWVTRTEHVRRSSPGGSWVAELDGRLVGFVVSFRRDLLWLLSSYYVAPGLEGQGIGRPLLDAALAHSRGCLRAMFAASDDPHAYRRYRLAGFSLHPALALRGVVDRSRLPVVEHVREGTPSDVDLMDSLDRRRREAGHGIDHALLASFHRVLVTDRPSGSGYAYLDDDGSPVLLAATDRRTASRLLWEALASTEPGATVSVLHVSAANEWAVDVGLEARLSVGTYGYLALRGMRPPMPYLHHGALM